ncbi:helix-turn-helix domain-containing protein [Nocardia sp. NPDC005366]|uniref:helix-turn-helix transcriptional regulator n=1 Tax=Nocardia sp. NPDC005366 TaxID=3156878 RepID=UPI0033B41F58
MYFKERREISMDEKFSDSAEVTSLHQPGRSHRPPDAAAPDTGAKRWLTRKEAADYLDINPRTLANWAALGHGPRYSKPSGRSCMYRLGDLNAYLEAHMVHTAEQPEVA